MAVGANPSGSMRTTIAQGLEVMRRFGLDAHAYIPGVGVLNGLTAGNYLDSAGTTEASYDGLLGRMNDAAQGLGAELVVDANNLASWTTGGAGVATSDSGGIRITNGGASYGYLSKAITTVVGASYKLGAAYVLGSPVTTGSINVGTTAAGNQILSGVVANVDRVFTATTTTTYLTYFAGLNTIGNYTMYRDISVREVIGIHATQPTPANQPTLRKGAVNLLTYSEDFSNASWLAQAGASKSGNDLILPVDAAQVAHNTTLAANTHTWGVWLSGAGTISLVGWNATDGFHGLIKVTLSATPTLYVTVIPSTAVNTSLAIKRYAGDTSLVTFAKSAVFVGTYTAETFPTYVATTTAPASNLIGSSYASFNGIDEYMSLSAVPWVHADDYCEIFCGSISSFAALNVLTYVGAAGAAVARSPWLYSSPTTGAINAAWRDDASVTTTLSATAPALNETFVFGARKVGNNVDAVKNNLAPATGSTAALGTTTVASALIGAAASISSLHGGKGNCYIKIKGTVSDADWLTLRRFAGLFGGVSW
jgi:hypothetical protein